jgi:anthranilate synthase/aminodeoxychorismate synthase-like glutamine amidotransferase
MHIALIDNEDSFTYNILNILRQLPDLNATILPAINLQVRNLRNFDKIIISPGPGLPEDFPVLEQILTEYHTEKPILGICLGHQAICTFYGANLFNLPQVQHGQSQNVSILNNSRLFKDIPEQINVGLYHSWIADRNKFPQNLVISAVSDQDYIMSVSHIKYDVHGVQFHPESHLCEYGENIIRNFIY